MAEGSVYTVGRVIIGTGTEVHVFNLGGGQEWNNVDLVYPDGGAADYFSGTLYRHDGTHMHFRTSSLSLYFP